MHKIKIIVIVYKAPITFVISGLSTDNGSVKKLNTVLNTKSDM